MYKDPWGYSKLACYLNCPQQFKFQFIDKLDTGSSAAMERGADLHKSCEAYLNGWDKELAPELSYWRDQLDAIIKKGAIAERAWGFDKQWELLPNWFHTDTWLRAKSDAHYVDGETLVVIDFKSGKFKVPPIEQIELYAICAAAVYPMAKAVRAEFWFLDQGKVYEVSYTVPHLEVLRNKYVDMVAPIYADKTWEANPSRDCAWCSYSKTKGGPCTAG
jgi:CRISPR/Cas system-associated exonuclease Cas4 (RecB family)